MHCIQIYSGTPQQRTPLGTKILSVIARCPQLRGIRYISGRHGMCNRAVEHNMAAFSELSFAVRWQGRRAFFCCTLAGKASFLLLYAGREG